ncbi:hypothetical protein BGY98DRAFT_937705 [Russula aff. rugulosa BPL654]|nr:hypothetical protein BGY98DRAFT_937705 [Russula aff. rugulosa BPL654]
MRHRCFGCPQLTFAVETGDIEVLNACMVEAKHEAKWPLQVQSTKHERGPDKSPREVPYERGPDWPPEVSYEHDPDILKGIGICKPNGATVGHVAILKNATRGIMRTSRPS